MNKIDNINKMEVFVVGLGAGFIATWFYLFFIRNQKDKNILKNENSIPIGMSDEPEKSTGSYTGG